MSTYNLSQSLRIQQTLDKLQTLDALRASFKLSHSDTPGIPNYPKVDKQAANKVLTKLRVLALSESSTVSNVVSTIQEVLCD